MAGVKITAEEVASANFLLPMLLLAIADNLGAAADADAASPTFSFRLKAASSAALGFEVSHIKVSSPRALSSAVMEVFQRSETDGEYVLDRYLNGFGEFFVDNNLNIFELEKKGAYANE